MGNDDGLDRKVLAAVERLGRALRAARQHTATRHHLSLLGIGVMEALSDGRARRVGDLAGELDIAQPTVSDAISALDRRGLISRERDPADLRSTLLTLSNEGAALAALITAELGPIFAAEAGTRAERAITLRVLLGEITRLQHAGVITVNRSCLSCRHYERAAPGERDRCLLLDSDLRDEDLRVDCPEHQPA